MQDEINLLNEKVDYLNDGNRRLHASYETRIQELQDKLSKFENQNGALLDQCQSGNQDAVIIRKELDLCRDELTKEQNSKEQFSQNPKIDCEGPIVGNNGFSLLKKLSDIERCQEYGIYDEPQKSLLIFDENAKDGNNERAVITRALSTYSDKSDEKYEIGNKDKIITSFNTNGNIKYRFFGACGVTHQGLIHFFGGWDRDYQSQHFGFDEKRDFIKYKDLEIDFRNPQCSSFMISKPNSQSGDKEVVLLCFDNVHQKNCYQYDGELSYFAESNERHYYARLGKYKDQLITVGHWDPLSDHQKTEILDRSNNGEYKWTLGANYNFSPTGRIFHYSMVNVPHMRFNEEYLLLIGGKYSGNKFSDKVHKYNGVKWSFFGNLHKTRAFHGSVFLNGRVFIIGGWENYNNRLMKTETWEISKSQFEAESTWPELNDWWSNSNYVFVIPYYINP